MPNNYNYAQKNTRVWKQCANISTYHLVTSFSMDSASKQVPHLSAGPA